MCNTDGSVAEAISHSPSVAAWSSNIERPRIGEVWANPKTRTFAESLIDCEEDRTLRAVLVGMLRDANRVARRHQQS
jgi:hypothetical protein